MKLLRRGPRRIDIDPGEVALHARDVRFDWTDTPLRWMPAEPVASHLINALNLLLPEGERMFCATYTEALPYVRDEKLREAMLGFIGQEAMHAGTHDVVLREVLAANGVDPAPYVRQAEYLFRKTLGPSVSGGIAQSQHLVERLAIIACLEHFFAYLGDWVLNADLEKFGADPRVADLFRWHGAEEVEHRSVVYDAYMYVDGSYSRKARQALIASTGLLALFVASGGYLFHRDPEPAKGRWWPMQLASASMRGVVPSFTTFFTEIPRYLRPGFHPSQLGPMDNALRYLAQSPAARGGTS